MRPALPLLWEWKWDKLRGRARRAAAWRGGALRPRDAPLPLHDEPPPRCRPRPGVPAAAVALVATRRWRRLRGGFGGGGSSPLLESPLSPRQSPSTPVDSSGRCLDGSFQPDKITIKGPFSTGRQTEST